MIRITSSLSIRESELEYRFVRASGPGGQNVNKTSTAVQLRFDVKRSPSLSEEIRIRAIRLAGRRLTLEGVLVIESSEHRTQLQNKNAAVARLVDLIARAAKRPTARVKTRPTRGSRERRIRAKQACGKTKAARRAARPDD
jgi:ribosome-associated protein